MNNLNKIFWSDEKNGYVVTRNEDIKYILSLDSIFSSKYGLTVNSLVDTDSGMPSPLSAKDGKDHSQDKKANIKWLNYIFTDGTYNEIKRLINYKISSLRGTVDLATELSEYIAVSTICTLLGYEDRYEDVKLLCYKFHNSKTINEYNKNINNIISFILQNKCVLKEYTIDQYEWLNISSSIFMGGYASVISSINNLLIDISKYKITNTKGFINESLRLGFVSPHLIRTAQSSFLIEDIQINRNDKIYLLINEANKDFEVWGEDANSFDQNRNHEKLITFGYGTHRCIGKRIVDAQLEAVMESIDRASKFLIHNIIYNKNITESSGLYKNIFGEIKNV